jgi:cobalamin biosynthesis protein CobW
MVDGPAVLAGQFAADPAAVEQQRKDDPELDHDRPLRELFEDQLVAADLVIVSKVDELLPGGFEQVRAQIAALTPPSVKVVPATRGEVPFDLVLGLGRASEENIDERHTHHDEDHEEGRAHNHELFDTIVLRPPTLERAALLRGLEAVVREHEVYRAKGFAAVEGKAMRLVVQGVGRRFDSYFDQPWSTDDARKTELVLIGSHLEREKVLRTLMTAAGA